MQSPERVFSARGCYAIGFLRARLWRAKAFRRWVLERPRGPHQQQQRTEYRRCPLLGFDAETLGARCITRRMVSTRSLNAALVLDLPARTLRRRRWHTLSHREIGGNIGISHTSVRNVLVRLDEWGLISREPSGTKDLHGFACIHAKIRQQLSMDTSAADNSLPWLH